MSVFGQKKKVYFWYLLARVNKPDTEYIKPEVLFRLRQRFFSRFSWNRTKNHIQGHKNTLKNGTNSLIAP